MNQEPPASGSSNAWLLWSAWGNIHSGRLDIAKRMVEAALGQVPQDAEAWTIACEIALQQDRIDDAVAAIDRAIALEPTAARHLTRARCCSQAADLAAARQAATDAQAMDLADADGLVTLGSTLELLGEHDKALAAYDRALAIDGEHLWAARARAGVLRALGRIEECGSAFDALLARNPHDYECQYHRSCLRTQTTETNHVAELLSLIRSGRPDWHGAVLVAHALAKELEDLGHYEAAFHHLENGAKIRRVNLRYDVGDDLRTIDSLIETFDAETLLTRPHDGHGSSAPIFVLGLPRTGSTLVERIIGSHSQVQSAGELQDFGYCLKSLAREANGGEPTSLGQLGRAGLSLPMERLGQAYLDRARPWAPDAPRFIDKEPLNSLLIGYIHLALPNAKIVHVSRDPMDACYAIYKYLFKTNHPFSYDQVELAEFYAGYRRLMDHWRRTLPRGRMIEVGYEALIADQRGETERLIAALGLPWEEACLNFQDNPAPSRTGSSSQVRRPLYASSVGQWRAYERQLKPLADVLRKHGLISDASPSARDSSRPAPNSAA